MNFQDDMLPFGGTHYPVEHKIWQLFETGLSFTLSELEQILKQNSSEIQESLQNLFIRYGRIIKDDFWDGESRYHYVDPAFWDSAYTKSYYSFTVNDTQNKKFLLIADTHIGNPNFENFKLLQNIYDKGITLGARNCFHLGDIFEGNDQEHSEEQAEKQLESFVKHYPNPSKTEMMTYALIGNNDEWIHGSRKYMDRYDMAYQYDLRCLSKYIPSFYTIPREKWETSFQGINTLFSHRLYINDLIQQKRLYHLQDIGVDAKAIEPKYQLLISGHLHCGFLFSEKEFEKLWIGVPSTSSMNMNGIVALFVSMNYENDISACMEITPLICDHHYSVFEGNSFEWNFQKPNKTYQKIWNPK